MPKTSRKPVVLTGQDMNWLWAANRRLVIDPGQPVGTVGLSETSDAARNTLVIRGDIQATGSNSAILSTGLATRMVIASGAEIQGRNGLVMNGADAVIRHAGEISAIGNGITLGGTDARLTVNGEIFATTALSLTGGAAEISIGRKGQLIGIGEAIAIVPVAAPGSPLPLVTITNAGLISGNGFALVAGQARISLTNSGTIFGTVRLGDGNDLFDNSRGSHTGGEVLGGKGSDRFVAGDHVLKVVEQANEGFDTLVSAIAAILPEHVERLELTGSAPLFGTGNEAANQLVGNAGDNWLFGLGGDDSIAGGEGNDRLEGGAGSDIFEFSPISGMDVVGDFELGIDRLRFTGVPGFSDAETVLAAASSIGPDTLIRLTGDQWVLLLGISPAYLGTEHILFG